MALFPLGHTDPRAAPDGTSRRQVARSAWFNCRLPNDFGREAATNISKSVQGYDVVLIEIWRGKLY